MDHNTDINTFARDKFFWQTDMIQFLLAENLALKAILHAKGLLTPEEFAEHKKIAEGVLNAKVNQHIEQWKKTNPDMVQRFEQAAEQSQLIRKTLG